MHVYERACMHTHKQIYVRTRIISICVTPASGDGASAAQRETRVASRQVTWRLWVLDVKYKHVSPTSLFFPSELWYRANERPFALFDCPDENNWLIDRLLNICLTYGFIWLICSASEDGTVILWNTVSGTPLKQFTHEPRKVVNDLVVLMDGTVARFDNNGNKIAKIILYNAYHVACTCMYFFTANAKILISRIYCVHLYASVHRLWWKPLNFGRTASHPATGWRDV